MVWFYFRKDQVEEIPIVLEDDIVETNFPIQVEGSRIILETNFPKVIDMFMPIYTEDNNIVLNEKTIEKVKFNGEQIEQNLKKHKSQLSIICLWKSLNYRSITNKFKMKMKYGYFRVLKKVDIKCYTFALHDQFLFRYKFYSPENFCFQ